ncbi:hypothetical protein BDV97DRAFT_353651 [Delphinella strobiligena]|nr:hypothetical protein BDV97DRAFT_353651 [Delphinella strobiligena]
MTRSVKATSYRATSEIQSFRKGSMQSLSNGNALLGYGNEPGFTEYDANGTVLYDVRFGPVGLDRETADNYRTLKVNWTGNPSWSPKISAGPFLQDSYRMLGVGATEALPSLPNNTAYFSWNGGTRLAKWAILASENDTRLDSMAHLWCKLPRTGFETSLQVGDTARYIRAIAISADDDVLSASPVLDMRTGKMSEQYWSPLDLSAQWKEGQTHDETEDDGILDEEYEALKEDWQSM